MPRTKPKRELKCEFCNKIHEYEKVASAEKLLPRHIFFENKLYKWSGFCPQENCLTGQEAFDPEEELIPKTRKITRAKFR